MSNRNLNCSSRIRPSLASRLSEVDNGSVPYVYDADRQISLDADGRPAVRMPAGEIRTFAEKDRDDPAPPGTSTKQAGGDQDADVVGARPLRPHPGQTSAENDDQTSPPSTVTEAGRDPGDVDLWVAVGGWPAVGTDTRAGQDADDPPPGTVTKAARDPGDVEVWSGWGSIPFSGQASDDAATGVAAF